VPHCGRLIASGSRCRRCAICGSTDGVQAHHVRELCEGGTDENGGVPLCARHYLLAHAKG
jgi:hypothetical protein